MTGISGVNQAIMQQLVMQTISESQGQLAKAASDNAQMRSAAQLGETATSDYSKG